MNFIQNTNKVISLIEKDHLGDWRSEKDCCLRLTFRQPVRKPFSESLKMAVEPSVANNSPSQDSSHPGDNFQSRYVIPRFKTFSC